MSVNQAFVVAWTALLLSSAYLMLSHDVKSSPAKPSDSIYGYGYSRLTLVMPDGERIDAESERGKLLASELMER